MNGGAYRPEVDGLRAIAVVAVIFYHLGRAPGGFVGVDIFFVLSGLLITSLLVRQQQEGKVSLVAFWERRCRRLLPALAVMLAGVAAVSWICLVPDDLMSLGPTYMAQAFLATNFVFRTVGWGGYFGNVGDTSPTLHTWSLAVEEQFYLLYPPLLLTLLASRRRAWAPVGLGVLGLLSLASCQLLDDVSAFYLLPSRASELLLGAELAFLPELKGNRVLREALGWFAVLLLGWSLRISRPGMQIGWSLVPCLATALFLAVTAGEGRKLQVARLASWRPLVWTGQISYSLYLWHWPVIFYCRYLTGRIAVVMQLPLLGLIFLLGALSYRWVETPWRRGSGGPWRQWVGVAALACLLVGWGMTLEDGWRTRFSERGLRFLTEAQRLCLPSSRASDVRQDLPPRVGADRPPSFLVWGDSHADAVAPILDELGKSMGVGGSLICWAGTPPLTKFSALGRPYALSPQELPDWSSATLDYVTRHQIRVVLLAAQWSAYPRVKPPATAADLHRTIADLKARGARVWVLKEAPQPGVPCVRLACLADKGLAPWPTGLNRAEYREQNRRTESWYQSLLPSECTLLYPGPYLYDPKSETYPALWDDHMLYSDGWHIGPLGARRLRPLFEPFLEDARTPHAQEKEPTAP